MLWTIKVWPIWVGCLLMIAAAVINTRTGKVPNVFTYPAAIVGLCVAVAFGEGGLYPSLHGSISSSVGAAATTFLILLFGFVFFRLGGGSLKVHTAFAAWLGDALPFEKALCLSLAAAAVIASAYCVANLVAKYSRRTEEEEGPRDAHFSQTAISFLTIATVVIFALLDLL